MHSRSCKFLWVAIAILLIAAQWFVDIQVSFRINKSTITSWRGGRNKTSPFDSNSVQSKTNLTLYTTVNETAGALRDSQGNCIPTPHYQPMAKLSHTTKRMDEPRINPDTAWKVLEVACSFHAAPNVHFPHAMQQLYRCFTYWLDYDTKEPFLLLPDVKVGRKLRAHPFIGGMIQIFEEQMEVEINHKTFYSQKTLEYLMKAPSISIQEFTGMENYSLRHTYHLHHFVKDQLELDDTSSDTCKYSKPRIAILNRREYSLRSILNAAQLANQTEIKELSRNDMVDVGYFEGAGFREQVSFFRSVDILITPHGAQLTGVAFMNAPCSHVLELFPKVRLVPFFFGFLPC